MTDQIHTDSEPASVENPFSPGYVSQIKPFRERTPRPHSLDCSPKYDCRKTIATPDMGKRARLLKANI